MPRFNTMDPEKIRALLEEVLEDGTPKFPDVLTPLAKKEFETFEKATCPKCQAPSPLPILDVRQPFTPGSPLPNRILRCVVCQTEFDPRSGLIHLANITDVAG